MTWISIAQVVLMPLLGLVTGALMVGGGMKLRQGEGAGMVYAGAGLAMVPCCSFVCCCFAFPAGAWAIVTMMDEDVKAAFAQNG